MASKNRKQREFNADPYDDYDEELDEGFDEAFDDTKHVSKDFYSMDWDDLSGSDNQFSTRRKIERRNDLKNLYAQFDDWDQIDIGNDW
jgi:hypothetical protein